MRDPYCFACDALNVLRAVPEGAEGLQEQDIRHVGACFINFDDADHQDFILQSAILANGLFRVSRKSFDEVVTLIKIAELSGCKDAYQLFRGLTTGQVSFHASIDGYKGKYEPLDGESSGWDAEISTVSHHEWRDTIYKEYEERMHVCALLYLYKVRYDQFLLRQRMDGWIRNMPLPWRR